MHATDGSAIFNDAAEYWLAILVVGEFYVYSNSSPVHNPSYQLGIQLADHGDNGAQKFSRVNNYVYMKRIVLKDFVRIRRVLQDCVGMMSASTLLFSEYRGGRSS